MKQSSRFLVAVLSLWVGACSGGRSDPVGSDRLTCSDAEPCPEGSECSEGVCTEISEATFSARADVKGAPATVLVIDAAGNACEASQCAELPYGSQVTFQASEVPGHRFKGWTGGPECTGSALALVIPTLTRDTHCTANYVRRVRISGHVADAEGGVFASSDSPFASCNGGSCEVDADQPVTLRAQDRFGLRFSGWSGEGCGDAATLEIQVRASAQDLVCTANFTRRVLVTGEAMNVEATITVSAPRGVCEPGSCVIDEGGSATLGAPEVPGFRFAGWSGTAACTGSDPVLALGNVEASQACVASYQPRVTVSGSASGAEPAPAISALSSDLHATCSGGSCQVDVGGSVTLLAGSVPGYRLTGWTGPQCEAERGSSVMLTMVQSDLACVANYLQGIAVMGAVVGAPGDVVASSTTVAAQCAEGGCIIDLGGDVTLTAPNPPGYRFLGWDGDEGCASQELTVSFPQVTASRTCYARYASRFLARGNPVPREGGSVRASSTSPGAVCEGDGCTLDGGGEVLLEATASERFRFSGWSGGGQCAGTEPVRLTDIQGNVTCQANFISRYDVVATSAPVAGGSVVASSDSQSASCSGASCQVDLNGRVSFTATAETGYRFVGWSLCSDASTPLLDLSGIRQDTACQANFELLRFDVVGAASPAEAGAVDVSTDSPEPECSAGRCRVGYGSTVRLRAAPLEGYRFVGWAGCSMSTEPSISLGPISADARCTARFERIFYGVSASATPAEGGTLTLDATGPGASCQGLRCSVPHGGGASLLATPSPGWVFAGWSGCSNGGGAALALTNIRADTACTATFARERFSVSGVATPTEGGVVIAASSASTALCEGPTCTVDSGSSVSLRATAAQGFRFTGWTGCPGADGDQVTIARVTSSQSCQANFVRQRFAVSGVAAPVLGGIVVASSTSPGAACEAGRCVVDFQGAVTLSAMPAPGFRFVDWSSCPVAGAAQITIADVAADVSCTAAFARLTFPVVGSVAASGGGTLAVASSEAASCQDTRCTVELGGSVVFVAAPASESGFTLQSFSGDCTASATNALRATVANVTGPATCVATFAPRSYAVTGVSGAGGSVSGNAAAGSCSGAACQVPHGTSVSFTATADAGFTFAGWSGCAASATDPLVATISSVTMAQTCSASFSRLITVRAAARGPGTVAARSAAGPCPEGACTVSAGTMVTLEASVAASGAFRGWSCSDGRSFEEPAPMIDARADLTCTASFVERTTITVSPNDPARGTASIQPDGAAECTGPTTCTVDVGARVTLLASANPAYVLDGWTGTGCTVEPGGGLIVAGPLDCIANFVAVTQVDAGTPPPAPPPDAGVPPLQ